MCGKQKSEAVNVILFGWEKHKRKLRLKGVQSLIAVDGLPEHWLWRLIFKRMLGSDRWVKMMLGGNTEMVSGWQCYDLCDENLHGWNLQFAQMVFLFWS
jgi:hypothetical protein